MQEAIPEVLHLLQKQEEEEGKQGYGGGRINVWVGDACLGFMKEQIDLLLSAREQGLLAPLTLFVLTLKCIVGRSRESFDGQVRKVVEQLLMRKIDNNDNEKVMMVDNLEVYHLFSNKNGE